MTTRSRSLPLLAALVGAVTLGACGSEQSSTGKASLERQSGAATSAAGAGTTSGFSGGAATTVAAASATTAASGASQDSTSPGGGGGATPVPVPPADRKVVMVVTLDVQVPNVASASVQVSSLAEGAGGYVASQQAALGAERPSSTLVLKVPPDKVTLVLQSIAGLGRVTNQTQQADDVTSQYFDLESRITTARASVERVRGFLSRTANVSELAGLEAELTRRETELEQLVAAQQGLAARSAMATVTVALTPAPPTTTTTVAPTTTTQPELTARRALRNGTDVLANIGTGFAIVGAFLLPFLPLLLIVAVVLWALRRRSARSADAGRRGGRGPGGGATGGSTPDAPAPAPVEREPEPASR